MRLSLKQGERRKRKSRRKKRYIYIVYGNPEGDMNIRKEKRTVYVITDNELIVMTGIRTILRGRRKKRMTRLNTM
jgi:hypothetical protein